MSKSTKKLANRWLHYGILVLIYGVGAATLFTHTVLHALTERQATQVIVTPCSSSSVTAGKTVRLTLGDSGVQPQTLATNRCDTLDIANMSTAVRFPVIGRQSHQAQYPGVTATTIQPSGHEMVVLTQTGTYLVRDHFDDSAQATIVIK